jgi:hypothetical protein
VPSSSFALRLIWFAIALCAACAREPEPPGGPAPKTNSKPKAAVQPAKGPTITPAEAMARLGPVKPEEEQHEPPPPMETLKTEGKLGEVLEGDVSHFKLLSMRPCVDDKHPAPSQEAMARKDPKARKVIAAEIEVVAKTRLNVAPRDLSLASGGITITSSVDPNREIKGCTPLLKFSRIQAKDTVRGFVLFDLPTWGPGSNLNEFKLIYHPARFGGAVALYVKLADVKLAGG